MTPPFFPIGYSSPVFAPSALGKTIGRAADQHSSNSLVGVDLIGTLALTISSILVQDLYDLERPNCAPSPTTLFCWLLAQTGEGKDFGAAPFLAPIHRFQSELEEQNTARSNDLVLAQELWRVERGVLRAQLAAALSAAPTDADYSDRLEAAKAKLEAHLTSKPLPKLTPRVLYGSGSSAAMTTELCKRWPAGALIDLDAGAFFARTFAVEQTFWNERWGGAPLYSDTVMRGSLSCQSPRLACALAVQPTVLHRVMQGRGTASFQESGFGARPLIAIPRVTAGTRILSGAPKSTEFLDTYAAVALDLLAESVARHKVHPFSRRVLRFPQAAKRILISHFNKMQALTGPGQMLYAIPGHAAKATENLARIAAIIHVLDGLEGDVSAETVEQAEVLMDWYTHQALCLHLQTSPEARLTATAMYVERVMRDAQLQGYWDLMEKDVHHLSNLPPREVGKALSLLRSQQRVFAWKSGRTWLVRLVTPASY